MKTARIVALFCACVVPWSCGGTESDHRCETPTQCGFAFLDDGRLVSPEVVRVETGPQALDGCTVRTYDCPSCFVIWDSGESEPIRVTATYDGTVVEWSSSEILADCVVVEIHFNFDTGTAEEARRR